MLLTKPNFALKKVFLSLTCAVGLLQPLSAFSEETPAKSALPLQEIRQFTDVYSAIQAFYVDEKQTEDKLLLENALAGMLAGLDPHSAYLDKEAFSDLKEGTEGEFGGLGLEVTMDASGVLVIAPIDDTPAARAGILAGDIIVKIDDQATRELSLNENVKRMRGKPKSKIKLTIARKGVDKAIDIHLTRDLIKVQSVKMKDLSNGIAYIRISQFQEHTANDLAKYLIDFNKKTPIKGIVLDLRNDPGGLLNAAVGVVSAFIGKDKVVVSTKGRTDDASRSFKTTPSDYLNYGQDKKSDLVAKLPAVVKTAPVVVLINAASASASEIVSGALQDHKRAKIMGQRSFGKGSVQTVLPLRPLNGGEATTGIKLTTSRYYTPSGRSIQATGITPDIELADTAEGNYASFNIREADLAHHLKSDEEKKAEETRRLEEAKLEKEREMKVQPKTRYFFGDKDDFQLQQAVKFLKGEKYLTGFEKLNTEKEEVTVMQQVLIHVIPIFFALYAFKSLFGKTRFHWAAKILIGSVMLIASQYPGLARSFFGNHDQEIPYLGILLLSWLFATQLLMILMAFIKDFFFVIAKVAFNRPIVKHATTGIIITSIATALATWGTYEALRIPPVYTVEVPIKHLPKAFDGFTIVQLSDLHASALLNQERLEKVVEKTNALKADLIVITGDIVDGRVQSRLNDVMPISKLSAPYGVIGIEGNHEHYVDYDGWMKTLPTLGIKMLHNEHVIIDIKGEKLAIIGINDPMAKRYEREMPNIKKALRGVDQQTPKILLSHQIKFSHDYAKEGIDLQLSGHTHGGQIFGMHWVAQMLNAGFVRDAYDVDGMKLYVNRGTGLWYGFPIRLGIGSEITLIKLSTSS